MTAIRQQDESSAETPTANQSQDLLVLPNRLPLPPGTEIKNRNGDPVHAVAPVFEPLDPSLIATMAKYPTRAVNGMVTVTKVPDPVTGLTRNVEDHSVVVPIPKREDNSVLSATILRRRRWWRRRRRARRRGGSAAVDRALSWRMLPALKGWAWLDGENAFPLIGDGWHAADCCDGKRGQGEGIPRNAGGRSLCVVGSVITSRYRAPEETGKTFRANACLKASYYAMKLNAWALADDSGLVVDALGGSPGVLSARWAEHNGAGKGDVDNNATLLKQLADVPDEKRSGRFVCALALSDPQGRIVLTTEDSMEGTILRSARGSNGFGYDPLFQVEGRDRTTAELSPEAKHAVSHRGKALRRMKGADRRNRRFRGHCMKMRAIVDGSSILSLTC